MKRKMILITIIFSVGLAVCGIIYYFTPNSILFSITVTLGTCFYHFAVRLIVGYSIDAIFRCKLNYNRWWFRERKFEAGLYKVLHVKNWKKYLPTYNSEYYDIKKRTIEEIIQATCQSEIVHEINMVLSFVPVIFTVWFGALIAFLITSCLACGFDGLFVIMQRYNRPRWKRLLKFKQSTSG